MKLGIVGLPNVGKSTLFNSMTSGKAEAANYPFCTIDPNVGIEMCIRDSLGAERNTSFGKERVFDVVDKRLLTGKPMIVTTNIPLSVMKQAARCV